MKILSKVYQKRAAPKYRGPYNNPFQVVYPNTALQVDFSSTPNGSSQITAQYGGSISLGLAGPIPDDSGALVGKGGWTQYMPVPSPSVVTSWANRDQVSVAAATGGLAGLFSNVTVFGDNSVVRYAYQTIDNVATAQVISFYIEMDDGGVPVMNQSNLSGDFVIIVNGGFGGVLVDAITHVGNNVYRVSALRSSAVTYPYFGITKYTAHSARTFKVAGFNVSRTGKLEDYYPSAGVVPVTEAYVSHRTAAGIPTGFAGHGAYTNKIQNPKCVGAAVDTLPTGWSKTANVNGITTDVVGAGSNYVDIRVRGTASALADMRVLPSSSITSVPAAEGQVWTFTSTVEKLSGSYPTGNAIVALLPRTSGGSAIAPGAGTSLKTVTNQVVTYTMPATTAFIDRYWSFTIANGETVDFTVRISKPQLIQSAYPHPFAAPDGTAIQDTSVPATSGSSANNGLYLAMSDKLLNALDLIDHNYVPNSEAVGAAAGTLPTGWIKAADANGITTTVVGAGDGYVDIRVSGTASAVVEARITPAINVATVAAAEGQVWTFTSTVEKLSGSYPTGNAIVALLPRTSGGSAIAPGAGTSIKTAIAPVVTYTMPATTAFIDRYWSFTIANGETVDFTIRISKPQLTKTSVARKYVPTYGTAVTPNPAQFTAAAIIWHRGAGSAELPDNTYIDTLSVKNTSAGFSDGLLHRFSNNTTAIRRPALSADGAGAAIIDSQTWARDTFTLQLVQSTLSGTKFRVGYQRFNADCTPIDASITWGTAGNFDGSFNPIGVLRWLYGITVPTDIRWTMVGTRGDDYFTDARIKSRLPAEFRS